MFRSVFLAASAVAFLAMSPFAASAADPAQCRNLDDKGNCLDSVALTGTYGATSNQYHGVVRLGSQEQTFIFAHNLCRQVKNFSSRGPVFIGLETPAEWKSGSTGFARQNPAGTSLTPCCVPVVVAGLCGSANKTLPFMTAGQTKTYTGGYNRKVVYRCDFDGSGIAATDDTSWSKTASGQCATPASNDDDRPCQISNDKDWCNSQRGDDGDSDGGRDEHHGDKTADPDNSDPGV